MRSNEMRKPLTVQSVFDVSALRRPESAGPRGILRVVRVLEKIGSHPEGQTLAQLCRSLAVPKTTLFALLKVLQEARYLVSDGGIYRLGPEAIALGSLLAESPKRGFPECARGALDALCRKTGETGFLAVLTSDRMQCRYVAVVETENWLRFSVKLGSRKPAYATGSGRAMLAFLPPAESRALIDRFDFARLTANTVSSRRALLASLKEVRSRGFSIVDSGTVAGVTSVAAPIFGADGHVIAALSAGGPGERISARMGMVVRAVCDGAEEISRIMGYRGDWPAG